MISFKHGSREQSKSPSKKKESIQLALEQEEPYPQELEEQRKSPSRTKANILFSLEQKNKYQQENREQRKSPSNNKTNILFALEQKELSKPQRREQSKSPYKPNKNTSGNNIHIYKYHYIVLIIQKKNLLLNTNHSLLIVRMQKNITFFRTMMKFQVQRIPPLHHQNILQILQV